MLKLEAATRRYGHALFEIAKSEELTGAELKKLLIEKLGL